MKALKFVLSGKSAFFKKPEVNSYVYFTYSNIHKVTLLGVFGAILGYSGYGQMTKDEIYPEFYRRLQHLDVAICPNGTVNGMFGKKIQWFNNSVGYASEESGGNLIVKQQWLDNPSWTIYIALNCEEAEAIKEAILNNSCVYIPYLGSNAHPANIQDAQVVEYDDLESKKKVKVDSLFLKGTVEYGFIDAGDDTPFVYSEYLPMGLTEGTNMYLYQAYEFTNCILKEVGNAVSVSDGSVIVFI